ncbi:sulfatase [Leeuwenhoekiella sp. ZYFB001]|uniref:sulfatase n=1 Tax=Leeuwenhoekiella sp. ZYFB001 TaxID=2719912 RepID=UPI001430FBC3|nr:sulfatase [Leeuwenhoekiella sp. ZYFB001]
MNIFKSLSWLIMLLSSISFSQIENSTQKPNVVFILVDDLGWSDLGIQGSKYYLTPRIDELAKEGIRFSNAYAANPVCSPTRASIMSGKDPADVRVNISNWIGAQEYENRQNQKMIQPGVGAYLPLEEFTMAEAFQNSGYKTQFIGKWHLGETEEYWPENQGFDNNIAGWSKGNPGSFFSPYHNPRLKDGPDGEYLPYRLGREAVAFIEEQKNSKDPFFLFFSMYNVHTPIEAPKELVERFEKRREKLGLPEQAEYSLNKGIKERSIQNDATYAAMIWAMDSVVGDVKDKLKELGMLDNTAIVFFSDNGGLSNPGYGVTSNKPLRGGKGWIYEGGIREPLIIKYDPLTKSKAGSIIQEPVISYDFYPTLLELSEIDNTYSNELEGKSLVPVLNGQPLERECIYWHYPHYSPQGGGPASAIRMGALKLIYFYETDSYELYNLHDDISEQHNLADNNPKMVKDLSVKLFKHLEKINASYPIKRPH